MKFDSGIKNRVWSPVCQVICPQLTFGRFKVKLYLNLFHMANTQIPVFIDKDFTLLQ